jgi:hypothetical protein
MKKYISKRKSMVQLIPWYFNGSLSEKERQKVDNELANDPILRETMADWKRLGWFVGHQTNLQPSEDLEDVLLRRVNAQSRNTYFYAHIYAIFMAAAILLVLWAVFRPGISLQWSAYGDRVDSFRIYRSINDSSNYELIYETSAGKTDTHYSYVDTFLIPWSSYSYVVGGIKSGEEFALSEKVSSRAISVLPGQLALIITSLILGYTFTWMIKIKASLLSKPSLAR